MGIVYGKNLGLGGDFYRYIQNNYIYFVHIFKNTANFIATTNLDIDYLIVGGGGGTPLADSGGGGGGGVLTGSMNISKGRYGAVVGLGGTPNSSNPTFNMANNGDNSSFNNIVALGGGPGGYYTQQPTNGASGGGLAHSCCGLFRTLGTTGQGYGGGIGSWLYAYGGGGGAGGNGQDGTTSKAGDGGIGLMSNITGTSQYYGGGGAGGVNSYGNTVTSGAGGLGGGGNSAQRGVDGLGGGGGGRSGYGGSGIVIIRYRLLLPTY